MTGFTQSMTRSATRSALGRAAVIGSLVLGLGACATATVPRYVVFFTAFSTDLDAAAKAVVLDAAGAARAVPTSFVTVSGWTDRAGTPEDNQHLSANRAQAVANELIRDGVAQGRIVVRPRGQTGGEPGVESRRVEINVGG